MSKEDRKMLKEYIKMFNARGHHDFFAEWGTIGREQVQAIENMLREDEANKKRIEELEALNESWKIELEQRDEIIDLMAEQLAGIAIWNNKKEEMIILDSVEEVKQYYEKKVEGIEYGKF